jgi:biopolymer transport protein ExbD
MNTTPLIDRLLVLLIMFIITLPMQSHAVKVDLPGRMPPPDERIDPIKNRLVVTADAAILWNGSAVSKRELGGLLSESQAMRPVPELHLQLDAVARYELVDEVLAMTKRANVTRMGFVGNDAYRTAF